MTLKMLKGATLSVIALAATFAQADTVRVTVDGTPVNFDAAQPEMVNGRVLVPLRGVFEQMGANVDWDSQTQSVTADGNGRHVRLQIGSYDASVNGRVVTMDVQPQVYEGSTMVPLRFLGQALGGHVDWQPQNDLVAISTVTEHHAAQVIAPPPPPPTPPTVIIERPAPPPPVIIERPAPPPPPPVEPAPEPYMIHRDLIVPLILDQPISSNRNHDGDHFTMSVAAGGYGDFPEGTTITGVVRSAVGASGDHAGSLDVRFTHIRFPDGHEYPVSGFVTKIDNRDIVESRSGRFFIKGNAEANIAKDTEIGVGASLVVGNQHGKIVGGAALGGTFGSVVGVFDHSLGRNVGFDAGAKFALVFDHDFQIERRDLRHR